MSVDTTLAVLYAQSGLSNQANAVATAPQASLAMSRVLAAEQARQERYQVEKNEKSEKSNINPDRHGGRQALPRRMRARRGMLETEVEAEPVRNVSPVVGNLLNVKV